MNGSTLLLRPEPETQQQNEADKDILMLGLFLDFLSRQALATTDPGPEQFTEAIAAEQNYLQAGVTIDAGDETCGE